MDKMELLKRADRQFVEPCIKAFRFLEKAGFTVSGSSLANEITVTYTRGRLRINIGFAVPAEIYVSVQEVQNGKITKDRFWRPETARYKRLAADFGRTRRQYELQTWLESFRNGTFEVQVASLLAEMAANMQREWAAIEAEPPDPTCTQSR